MYGVFNYLHLVGFYGKCKWVYHTWMLCHHVHPIGSTRTGFITRGHGDTLKIMWNLRNLAWTWLNDDNGDGHDNMLKLLSMSMILCNQHLIYVVPMFHVLYFRLFCILQMYPCPEKSVSQRSAEGATSAGGAVFGNDTVCRLGWVWASLSTVHPEPTNGWRNIGVVGWICTVRLEVHLHKWWMFLPSMLFWKKAAGKRALAERALDCWFGQTIGFLCTAVVHLQFWKDCFVQHYFRKSERGIFCLLSFVCLWYQVISAVA